MDSIFANVPIIKLAKELLSRGSAKDIVMAGAL